MIRMNSQWGVALGLATFTMATGVQAQQSNAKDPSRDPDRVAKAEQLESEARGLHNQRHRWDYAAVLYRAAAELRQEGDPQLIEDLVYAARFSYYERKPSTAIADLERAGESALASGDIVRAADLFADAAWVAQMARLRASRVALGTRVAQLADTPGLSPDDRAQILSRFEGGDKLRAGFLPG